MRRTRLGGLLALLLVGLITPVLIAAPAQATSESGTPFGIQQGDGFTVNKEAEKVLGPRLRAAGSGNTAAGCQGSYTHVHNRATGDQLNTNAPGNTINVHAFTILHHGGIFTAHTRAIFFYRWAGGGFDYYTTFTEDNCIMRFEPNALSAQNFPAQNTVDVSVCFIPWEVGQVVCGPLGNIFRDF